MADQLTSQKLEENPLLPLDNQQNLVYTLTRIFRLLAQIVNPLVAWAAKWSGIEPSNGSWGNVLIIKATPPKTGKGAALILQAEAPDGTAVLAGDRPPGTRLWNIVMPTADVAGDFAIERLPTTAASFRTLSIARATGVLTTETHIYAGADQSFGLEYSAGYPHIKFSTDGRRLELSRASGAFYFVGIGNDILFNFAPNGDFKANGKIEAASGMGMMYDGGNANYLSMGAGVGAGWSWQYQRDNGTIRWMNWEPREIFRIEGGGAVWSANGYSTSGNMTCNYLNVTGSNGSDSINAAATITTSARFYQGGNTGINEMRGGVQCGDQSVNGYQFNSNGFCGVNIAGNNGVAGQYTYCEIGQSNPGWNLTHLRSWHQHGQWAGFQFYSDGTGNVIQMVLSNGGAWGSMRAASFDVQSDARSKREVRAMDSALDVLEGIQAHTYEYIPPERDPKDKTPIYGKTRYCGTLAQDWQDRLPEAVTDAGDGNLMLDYAAIGAVTAQAVSELLARIKAQDARIAALERAST